jgi:hypothetical protein
MTIHLLGDISMTTCLVIVTVHRHKSFWQLSGRSMTNDLVWSQINHPTWQGHGQHGTDVDMDVAMIKYSHVNRKKIMLLLYYFFSLLF